MKRLTLLCAVLAAGCHHTNLASTGDAGATAPTCTECLVAEDCGGNAACVQYAGSDYCGHRCTTGADCAADELCLAAVADDGTPVNVCAPRNGTCGDEGCGVCSAGTTCDVLQGLCLDDADAGDPDAPGDGGCGVWTAPDESDTCGACLPDDPECQANGCYAGWWCDGTSCHAPPDCGAVDAGLPDAGVRDAGTPLDAGVHDAGVHDAGVPLGVTDTGGYVNHLRFVVIGDTRPPITDDDARYPTAIVTRIFQDFEAMTPKPQFAIATGDYMFARANGTHGETQVKKYVQARNNFSNPLFASMGNHECYGPPSSNCNFTNMTNNMESWFNHLVKPLGKTKPYYAIDVQHPHGNWTSKFLIVACNAWSPAQKTWLQNQLARPTTYTFVVRHEPRPTDAPCGADMNALLTDQNYTMLLTGHLHTTSHSGKQLIEGLGGAPITGNGNYGYALIEQLPNGHLKVTQYDYHTGPVSSYTLVP